MYSININILPDIHLRNIYMLSRFSKNLGHRLFLRVKKRVPFLFKITLFPLSLCVKKSCSQHVHSLIYSHNEIEIVTYCLKLEKYLTTLFPS